MSRKSSARPSSKSTKAKAKAKKTAKAQADTKTKSGAAQTEQSQDKKILSLLPAETVRKLINGAIRHGDEVREANKGHGKIMKEAIKKGLNRKAFTVLKQFVKLGRDDPQELYVTLAHFDDMRTKIDLDGLAEPGLVGPGTELIEQDDLLEREDGDDEKPAKAAKPGPAVDGPRSTVSEIARNAGAETAPAK